VLEKDRIDESLDVDVRGRRRSRHAMRRGRTGRLALLAALAVGGSGCFVTLGSPLGGLGGGDRPLEQVTVEGEGRARILVIDVTGTITDTPSKHAFGLIEEESTVARVEAELKEAADDDRIKAIVLRIDSPGGGVTASDELYGRLVRFKREHQVPILAALGDTAASGGYYVACAADRIVASPTTVTGSIGVILMSLDLQGLLAKIGVKDQTFKAGAHKDLLSPLRATTPEERQIVQRVLDTLHARFIAVVREGRPNLDVSRLAEITDGRIFVAEDARALGLVDDVASLHDALEQAKQLAGVQRARIIRYRRSGESAETVYAQATAPGATQVNLMPIDFGELALPRAAFLYYWAPGIAGP
jgi:protease-4